MVAVLALASCDKKENEEPWNGEIRLRSGLEEQVLGRSDIAWQNGDFVQGVKVGFFINEAENVEPHTAYDSKLWFEADGYGKFRGGTPQYYPRNGGGVNIHAYAPYDETYDGGVSGKMTFTVKADQSLKADYLASDLLWGQPMKLKEGSETEYVSANPVARTKDVVEVCFSHLLSRVYVRLVNEVLSGIEKEDMKGATINVVNALPETTLNMADGSLSGASGNRTDVTLVTLSGKEVTCLGYAVVVPQTFKAGEKFLRVTLGTGGDLYYVLPTDLTLEPGKRYEYDITVKLTGLQVKSTITEWKPIGASPVKGTAEML